MKRSRGDGAMGRNGTRATPRGVVSFTRSPAHPLTRSRRSGFTLLEMMVALSVMSIAMIALLRVVIGNVNAVADARDRTIAAGLAEAKLHDIERDSQQQTADGSGNFGEENKYFSWTSQTQETQWPSLKRVGVTIVWIRGKVQKQLSVETLIRIDQQPDSTDTGAAPPGGSLPACGSSSGPGKARTP